MRVFRFWILLSAISLVSATSASAMTCRDWDRLEGGEKASAIDGMIQDALASQKGRSYGVNRGAIGRCMFGEARNIEYDFDDACLGRPGMQALNAIFKNYIWSCVN